MQVNLRKRLYDEAILQGKNIPEWINKIAENDLFPKKIQEPKT